MTYADVLVQRSPHDTAFTADVRQRAAAKTAPIAAADPFSFAWALVQGAIWGVIGGSAVSAAVIATVLGLRQLMS